MTARAMAWLGIAALLVAGCSNGASSQSEASSASAAPPSATTEPSGGTGLIPAGRYTADIPEGVEAAPGHWAMTIGADGIVWNNPETGATFSPGDVVEVTSTKIVFAPDPQCPGQDEPTEGTYEWSWDGQLLRFTVESDSCLGRRDTLATAPWELAP